MSLKLREVHKLLKFELDLLPCGDAVPRRPGVEVPAVGFQQGAVSSQIVQHHTSVDGCGAGA